MSLEFVRQTYGVPAKQGAAVQFKINGAWRNGIITAADHHVIVRPIENSSKRFRFHPTDGEHLIYTKVAQ